MAEPIVYGPSFSTYARTVRVVLEEKGVPYQLKPVNIIAGEGHSSEHMGRHPFGKVPAFEHDGFSLYETGAISRYIDRVFPGPALQPDDPKRAARMDQIIAVIDFVRLWVDRRQGRVAAPGGADAGRTGRRSHDPELSRHGPALPRRIRTPQRLERVPGRAGDQSRRLLPRADLCLSDHDARRGGALRPVPGLRQWWAAISERPSMQNTPPQFG